MALWREVMDAWVFAPVPILLATVTLLAYGVGVRKVTASRAAGWAGRRTAAYVAGVLSGLFAIVGPAGALDGTFFTAHMLQHLVLMLVAAPLVVIGAPVLLLLEASPPRLRRQCVVPLLRSRLARWLTRPAVGWALFAGTVLGTHFSPFYNYAIEHPLVHDYVEHPLYLTVAVIFYYPLLGSNPVPHGPAPLVRVLSLFLMAGPMTMAGFFIYTARSVLYPAYLSGARTFGPDPLADQQLAGALMWCLGMVVEVGWVALAVPVWLRAEERQAQRLDPQVLDGRPAGVP